ncbi:MAG: NAD-dependent malic enzyme [Desulfarculales bacterium]|jgi:malate dehydrogenase (oxaloacetate-decarboxylating)|nr:NAD-dependent malic enzyme [Desulfarculales bacterium]
MESDKKERNMRKENSMPSILSDPFKNKGTAFTAQEREKYGITGQLPPKVQTLEQQAAQVYEHAQKKLSKIEKRKFLMQIYDANRILFYKTFSEHIDEFMPIVYDPTVAQSITAYSEIFVNPQNSAFLDINHPENIRRTLLGTADGRDIKLAVVTDSEEILGIGDWGVNGIDISVGKLAVYTAAAGLDPATVLPVVIDAGTNNQLLLNDPLYLGNSHPRIRGQRYDDFIDKFVTEIEDIFPHLYLHWEDFGILNAARILDRYKDKILTFNDDIQGTGITVAAGLLGAMKLAKAKLSDQIYMSFGAGTAGAGIVNQVLAEMTAEGLSEREARSRFYLVDKQGLLFDDDQSLRPAQRPFARSRREFAAAGELTNLTAAVKAVKPTVLVGTSTQPGAFTEEIVRYMSSYARRPVIFPLSNPTELMEAKAGDLIKWSEGRALTATGVPSDDVCYQGKTYRIGQGNNALVYPGLGLGAIAARARLMTQGMFSAAAHALANSLDDDSTAVLPPLSRLNEFSRLIAVAVAQRAIDEGLAQGVTEAEKAVAELKWTPQY